MCQSQMSCFSSADSHVSQALTAMFLKCWQPCFSSADSHVSQALTAMFLKRWQPCFSSADSHVSQVLTAMFLKRWQPCFSSADSHVSPSPGVRSWWVLRVHWPHMRRRYWSRAYSPRPRDWCMLVSGWQLHTRTLQDTHSYCETLVRGHCKTLLPVCDRSAFLHSSLDENIRCSINYTWCSINYTWCSINTWWGRNYTWCSRNYTWCSRNYTWCSRNYTWCSRNYTWCSRNYTWCSRKLHVM